MSSENVKCSVSLGDATAAAACEEDGSRWEPVPWLNCLYSFSLCLSLSLGQLVSLVSSNRAVDPSRLEVIAGHRLNQSKSYRLFSSS